MLEAGRESVERTIAIYIYTCFIICVPGLFVCFGHCTLYFVCSFIKAVYYLIKPEPGHSASVSPLIQYPYVHLLPGSDVTHKATRSQYHITVKYIFFKTW